MNSRVSRARGPSVRRAVVLFPSGLTLANLFFGVFAIIAASRGHLQQAGWYVVLGGICDAFDGRVARATNTGGRFGEELDSLVDAITFGLAPALIMYHAVLNKTGWDWVWAYLFVACAVLRLARFNVEQAGSAKTYFQGLPSPAAGITLATYYWFSQSPLYRETNVADWPWHDTLRVVMGTLSFLMISNVPYPVVPNIGFRSAKGLVGLAVLIGGVSMLIFGRLGYFFPLAVAYVAFGLVRAVGIGWLERKRAGAALDNGDDDEPEPALARAPAHHDAAAANALSFAESGETASATRRRRRRRRGRGDRPSQLKPPHTSPGGDSGA
ncbi:MAG: CDP-diacylglycerol--serine O-phosphatidyltransferase [Gemmatimonadaceae bacterium]